MSDVLYPLGPIGQLDVQRFDRTIFDEFEDGSQQSRRLWTSKFFKRRFTVGHENLSEAEFRALANFFTARDGRYDSFWYRDNHNRAGNAKVRLAGDFPIQRGGPKLYSPRLVLEQTAPVRELVTKQEIIDAVAAAPSSTTISAPTAWWDANRTIYYAHNGTNYQETLIPDQSGAYDLAWVGGSAGPLINSTGQNQLHGTYSTYYATGTEAGIAGPAWGTQDALTIFVILIASGSGSGPKVITHAGSVGAQTALGIQIDADAVRPWVGASEVWTGATIPTNAVCSVAVTWANGSNAATTFVNGSSTAAGTNTRAYSQGAFSLGAARDGTKIGAFTVSQLNVAHAMYFHGIAMSAANLKAIHNLFVHQYSAYGMATVS